MEVGSNTISAILPFLFAAMLATPQGLSRPLPKWIVITFHTAIPTGCAKYLFSLKLSNRHQCNTASMAVCEDPAGPKSDRNRLTKWDFLVAPHASGQTHPVASAVRDNFRILNSRRQES